MLIELIENNISIGILAQLDAYSHTLSVRLISKVCYSVNLFILYKLCYLLDEISLVDHIWNLRHNDTALAIRHSFYIRNCTNLNLASSCTICLLNSSLSDNHGSCREIRTLDNLHEFLYIFIFVMLNLIVNNPYDSSDNLTKIVRRYIGCHTYSDT